MPSGLAPMRSLREDIPSRGSKRPSVNTPAPKHLCRVFYSYYFRHRARELEETEKDLGARSKWALGRQCCALSLPTETGRAEQIFNGYDERGECENRIKEFKRDVLARTDFPAIAIAPMPFAFNSTRWLTNCSSFSVFMPLEKPNSLMPAWKLYGFRSCLKSVPGSIAAARHLWFHLSSSRPRRELFSGSLANT